MYVAQEPTAFYLLCCAACWQLCYMLYLEHTTVKRQASLQPTPCQIAHGLSRRGLSGLSQQAFRSQVPSRM